jgi:hypothetical protein
LSIYSRFDQFALMHVNFDHWRLAVKSAMDSHKVKPRSRVDTFTTYTACELVCRGLGLAVVDVIYPVFLPGGPETTGYPDYIRGPLSILVTLSTAFSVPHRNWKERYIRNLGNPGVQKRTFDFLGGISAVCHQLATTLQPRASSVILKFSEIVHLHGL